MGVYQYYSYEMPPSFVIHSAERNPRRSGMYEKNILVVLYSREVS